MLCATCANTNFKHTPSSWLIRQLIGSCTDNNKYIATSRLLAVWKPDLTTDLVDPSAVFFDGDDEGGRNFHAVHGFFAWNNLQMSSWSVAFIVIASVGTIMAFVQAF